MKYLLMQLQYIYDKLKDEKEIAIIKKCGYNAKRYTVVFMGKVRLFSCCYMLLHFLINIYTIKILVEKNQF